MSIFKYNISLQLSSFISIKNKKKPQINTHQYKEQQLQNQQLYYIKQQKIKLGTMSKPKKNHFTIDSTFTEQKQDKILTDRVDKVMKQKFVYMINVYLNNAYETGYNSALAFRVISLYLYCDFKKIQYDDQDQQFQDYEIKINSFNLIQECSRFIDHELAKGGIANVRKCMDLLLLKPLGDRVADKFMKFWRIKVLAGLKKYYAENHMKKQKKKASLAMRELCKQQLKKQAIRHQSEMYAAILDILLDEQKIILNSKKGHGKYFQAIENANNIIRILQKADQLIIPKYQQQLMLAYWETAKLHNQLHYATYAKKYCQTALNIAERINDKKIATAARQLLQSLTMSQ